MQMTICKLFLEELSVSFAVPHSLETRKVPHKPATEYRPTPVHTLRPYWPIIHFHTPIYV